MIGRKRDLIVADFSTTGPAERAASEIVLLDAMRPYFREQLYTMCGIPRITLLGTVEDWRSLQERARAFGEFGLEEWVRVLEPVLEQFVAASRGRPDASYWRGFYKFDDMSGGPYVTGWINVLFPFVRADEEGTLGPNPHALRWRSDDGARPDDFPSGLSSAPFEWRVLDRTIAMEFLGGFAGVSQDPDTLALRPEIGWAVRPAIPSGPIEPQRDPATGQRVHHVLIVGAPGPALDAVLDEVRRSGPTSVTNADGTTFDVLTGGIALRVHAGVPTGVVPAGVVLVISERAANWPEEARISDLERTLLATGRVRDVRIEGIWDSEGATARSSDAFDEALSPAVRSFFRYVSYFVELEQGAGRRAFDSIRERLVR